MLNMCLIHWPNEASRSVYCKRHLLNQAAQCAGDFILQHDVLDVTFDTFIQGLYNYFYEPPGVKKFFNAIIAAPTRAHEDRYSDNEPEDNTLH